jgi:predicted CopG family antitoxin
MHIRLRIVKPVSLSDPAFEALRSEKQDHESDSDVVLRLVREARSARKDPHHFLRSRSQRERAVPVDEHEAALARMHEADRAAARQAWEDRHGGA